MCDFQTAFLQRVIPIELFNNFEFDKHSIIKFKNLVDPDYLYIVLKEALKRFPFLMEDDEIMEIYSKALSTESSSYHQHFILKDALLSFRSSSYLVSQGTTAKRIWDAGFALVDFLFDNLEIFCNKRIMELGCGTGFAGIVLAHLSRSSSIFLTDLPEVLDNVTKWNIENNYIENINYSPLDWNLDVSTNSLVADIIIGSDLIFDPEIASALALLLNSHQSKKIYIMQCVRNPDTISQFLKDAPFLAFKTYEKKCKSFYYQGLYYLIYNRNNP
jgi:predicted nicotinamide N-methyase